MIDDAPKQNTDREIWREVADDYYSDRIFVTAAGGIGIDSGGHVIVQPLREWHRMASEIVTLRNFLKAIKFNVDLALSEK